VGWWSSAVALRGEAANHRKLLRLRVVVVSVAGKVVPLSAAGMDQEGERERTTVDVSKGKDEIETGLAWMVRDEPGGYPSTAQVVSGMEVARAWSGLRCGTCEPVVPCLRRPVEQSWPAVVAGRESPERQNREGVEY
jgi:hypothetical protein